ncbi:hypothetical protein VTH06DRAFT_5643 [Thermothelomyces fergusii]
METRSLRTRVPNACDLCKLRKIKCSGARPCAYCVRRRQADTCHYTTPRRRPKHHSDDAAIQDFAATAPAQRPSSSSAPSGPGGQGTGPYACQTATSSTLSAIGGRTREGDTLPSPGQILHPGAAQQQARNTALAALEEHEETEVPREARLLCDAQGKLIFIGDCAPLSFFQTVRRLVTSRVDAEAFAPETSGYSALENVYSRPGGSGAYGLEPPAVRIPIRPTVAAYIDVTAGLIDIFDNTRLAVDIAAWAEGPPRPRDASVDVPSAVNYLVLAIGCQKSDEHTARLYFEYARNVAFASLSGNVGVASVQAFILVTLYSLGACQINGAFLFFGIAARAAYSIGIHRTVVNARFGPDVHHLRDRLWKSLRVLDLFLSTSMGRPPATSDVDCTVPYRAQDEDGQERFDLLNASAQIFLVIEAIVLEVYSRRKISPRLTEGISRELREWSDRWLQRLRETVDKAAPSDPPGTVNGACQVLSNYYYAVILVSRPFLMVELHRRLSEKSLVADKCHTGKAKLADACIDAAILMVEPVQSLIERGLMTRRAPVIVSWLFASSLVLGMGLMGGFGRIIEKHCRASIAALEYFAQADTHAVQYSLIAKSLLRTALQYLEKREIEERQQRTESSSQLFGLIPRTARAKSNNCGRGSSGNHQSPNPPEGAGGSDKAPSGHGDSREPQLNFDFESTLLGLGDVSGTPDFSVAGGDGLEHDAERTLGALNLFPLLETDGHIDLANYF